MSSHALARPAVSPMRVGALSTALALHLAGFGLLVLPPTLLLATADKAPADIVIEFVAAEVPPPPVPVPPVPPPPIRPPETRVVQPEVVEQPVPRVDAQWAVPGPVVEPVIETTGEPTVDVSPPATVAALAYADVPAPPYPPMARKRNWQGEVLLRVRVDETGKPVAVEIEKSSGHRLLDRTARDHVLRRWRFQPALVQGRPVPAWARVPVKFKIDAI